MTPGPSDQLSLLDQAAPIRQDPGARSPVRCVGCEGALPAATRDSCWWVGVGG